MCKRGHASLAPRAPTLAPTVPQQVREQSAAPLQQRAKKAPTTHTATGRLATDLRTLILFLMACLLLAGCAPAAGPPPAHLTEAGFWRSPSSAWEPPTALAAACDGVNDAHTRWETVALPHARPRQTAADPMRTPLPPEVAWYRADVPAAALAPTPEGPRLYIPRWQTVGTVAVYAGDTLVWQTRGSRVMNSFNHPVWVDLGGVLPPAGQPLVLHVRMASLPGVGGALSTLWAGPAEALEGGWRARTLMQTQLVAFTRGSYLIVGVFALGLWLLRRRQNERIYLWFFLMAVFQLMHTLHFLVDNEGFGLSDRWFSWLVFAVGAQGSAMASFYFLSTINRLRWPRWNRALKIYAALIVLVSFPPLGLQLQTMLPLLRLTLLPPALLVAAAALWGAWRQRTASALLLAVWIVLAFPIGFHDLALQSYRISIERIYLSPYVYVGLFSMFLVIAYGRYRRALEVSERANQTLVERLAEQERALAETHARLLESERVHTLLHERQRLMREMHDGVGSSLMSALRWVEGGRPGQVDVAQVLRECIDDLKISIDSLEPVDADLLTLLANLRYRLAPRLEGAGLALHWQVQDVPPLPWLDAQSALHVLRILQEVLTNLVKHSGARSITLRTASVESDGMAGVQVQVIDDGTPFAPPAPGAYQPGRKGLGNVQARAQALGAQVDWTPQPDGGTVFTLWLPLQGHADNY